MCGVESGNEEMMNISRGCVRKVESLINEVNKELFEGGA